MKYADLKVTPYQKTKRLGRGIASGKGKTSGRGTKGQKARTGSKAKPGFSGGSNPLMQKLPKLPGFTSHRQTDEVVYTGELNQFAGKIVDADALAAAGLISSAYVGIKVITKGDLKSKLTLRTNKVSASALEAVEKNGGKFERTPRKQRPITTTKTAKNSGK